ncbi:hypothetical protein SIN8267_02305 [Sinobacterium norvegicum]|uniref:Phage protein n=1 Tax=Sinobacterium norvegicum TaxID=1641715 RepID=A0ABN8EIJ2_9GAMM|nr:hypothetical protein [Sinobacterium norvegicum]CAH0992189.1 hypothetical protein SIN8267_02305 [Sinobacterium norvegicum]
MKITTTITLRIGKPGAYEYVAPGTPVNLPNEEAEYLVSRGFSIQEPSKSSKSTDLIDAIMDAIDDLKPDAFGKDGKPSVKAIEEILGQGISGGDRDKAWDAYQCLIRDER